MTHFRQAYQELRDTNTTIDKLGFQSANAIVEKIVERLREVEENEPVILPPPPPPNPQAIPIQPQQKANAMIPQVDQTSLVHTMMHNMQIMHYHMHQNYITGDHGRGPGRGRGCSRDGHEHGQRRTQSGGGSYCHTHGNCNHLGENCNTPVEKHNLAATFNNMLGGSAAHFFWITPE